MSQPRDLKPARRPPHLRTLTDIHAPRIQEEVINGKVKCSLTPAKPGVITIYDDDDDDENEDSPTSRPRLLKRERSQFPPRAAGHGHQPSQPRIKQEKSPERHEGKQSHGTTLLVDVASGTRQPQVHEPLRRRGASGTSNPSDNSPSSSDSSGSESSDSSEPEDESYSSSDSTSSDGSSSEDERSPSAYRPSTPPSSFGSSPPQTRRMRESGGRADLPNLGTDSPLRQSVQSGPWIGSRLAPLDFFIDVPTRPFQSRPEQVGRSRSQTSPRSAPGRVQAGRTAHSNSHRPSNGSPVVQGFMPINRRSPPPPNAPTEPRAMRTGEAPPVAAPVAASQRSTDSISEPVSGSSSPFFPDLPLGKDKSQQRGQQRRGPARTGRIMQTIEQPYVELPSSSIPPRNTLFSQYIRPATPGPSFRRPATPQPSPGMIVPERAESVRPRPIPSSQDAPSVSRSRGKRPLHETGDADSSIEAVEPERMLQRFRDHEKEMKQQRAQLERQRVQLEQQRSQQADTNRLLAELKTRVDDLEQRQRAEEHLREHNRQTRSEERNVTPPQETAPRHVAGRRDPHHQSERREGRGRCNGSRVARAALGEQERQGTEQEREDLELEQQLEQDQRRAAERLQNAVSRAQVNAQRASAQIHFETEAEAQLRIQHEVFTRPLSGHNPSIIFEEGDRGEISKATAFLMRLSQAFVLNKLRQLVEGRTFFDLTHPGSVYMGCWMVSKRASCDMRMKLTESKETHGFSFERLAVRLWHDEQSIYSLLQHGKHDLKAVRICHTDRCMHPDHIVVEPAGKRRRCRRRGRCPGHTTVHKDGTTQIRKSCIFPPRGIFVRQ